MKITIGHLYPDLLNLYGDRGNIQCLDALPSMARHRGRNHAMSWEIK